MVKAMEVLAGRYEVSELLGTGGMGHVHRARDKVLHRQVAVKLLKDELSSDPATVERFKREARIAASLSHPNIAAVFDFLESSGRWFIVMELLQGSDLHRVLNQSGALPLPEALRITAAVAGALNHAHSLGAVHRDIKPGNIFITDDGAVKVTDFGIATAAAQTPLTATGDVLGTPHYLSPEQLSGEPATSASDVYSLGCVLFEMITGRRPYEAGSSMAVALAHSGRPVPVASEVNSALPPEIDSLISKAMAKQPPSRFDSAGAFGDAARALIPAQETVPAVDGSPGAAEASTVTVSAAPRTLVDAPARRGAMERPPLVAGALIAAMSLIIVFAQLCGSAAASKVPVPNFVSLQYEAAAERVGELGLKVRRGLVALSDQPAGAVYAQRPQPGDKVSRGSSVMLFVSSGKGSRTPDLVNSSVDRAEQLLGEAGLRGMIARRVPGEQADIVVAQDPAAATLLTEGSFIRLTVTSGPDGESEDDDRQGDGGRPGDRGKGKGKGNGD